ncbi:MAG TPA: TonB-dependent receptor [Comamonas sp.]
MQESVFSPPRAWQPIAVALVVYGTGAVHAQQDPAAEVVAEEHMPTVEVTAESLDTRHYTRAKMDATPQGNRDLTSLIANHPTVRQNVTVEGSGNHGSLEPQSFSIHGESPYQNQFLVEGMSATNVISPHNNNLNMQVGNVPGFAQAYNLDTELLDAVEVHDSRVPVEFGHFTGGVVDTKIKTPQGRNRIAVKRSFNSSHLTQQRMPDADKVTEAWTAGEPGYSAVWKKHFSSVQTDWRLSAATTALFSFSRRTSEIERTSKVLDRSSGTPNGKTTQLTQSDHNDTVDNLFAKFHTHWGNDLETNLLLKYADRQEDLVDNFYADTAWTNQQTAYGLGLEAMQKMDSGKLTLKLGVDQLNAQRDASATEFVTQQFVDKSLSQYVYGGYGTESLEQRQLSSKLRMDWNGFTTGRIRHKLYAGLDAQAVDASFQRAQDTYGYRAVQQLDGSQKYFSKTHYLAGTAEAGYNSLGLYLNDSMQWHHWTWSVGARVDRDNFFKNSNLSPRTRLDWDVQGTGTTQLSLGWARYYGLDLLGYALEQEKSRLKESVIDSKGNAVTKPAVPTVHSYNGIRTPYSDEWALSLTQQWSEYLEGGVSYVRRASRDAVTRDSVNGAYVYTNGGNGRTETATLTLKTLKPWHALAAHWNARMDFSWQDSWRNHDSVQAWEAGAEAADDLIVYNDQQILRKDKPASEFNQPRRLSLGFSGAWQQQGITWGNRMHWNSSKQGIAYLGISKATNLEQYASQTLASYWTWDTSITWRPQQMKGLSVNIDILNVLNRQPPIAVTTPTAANNVRYQTGREIWLNAAYEF